MKNLVILICCWCLFIKAHGQASTIPLITMSGNQESWKLSSKELTWIQTGNNWFPEWRYMPKNLDNQAAGAPRVYLEGPPYDLFNDSTFSLLSLQQKNNPIALNNNSVIATRFILDNPTEKEKKFFLRLPNAWQANIYWYPLIASTEASGMEGSGKIFHSFNGKWVPIQAQQLKHYQNFHELILPPYQSIQVLAEVRPLYSIYRQQPAPVIISSEDAFYAMHIKRLLWQGIFFGVIMVMALYNLFLFFAVKDNSYLHYVLSIIGVGLYFAFYYGFGMEYLWPNAPRWDTWCYTLIVPFTSLARLWFTRTYLHTPTTLPGLNRLMNVFNVLMSCTFIIGFITYLTHTDWLAPLVTTIGILNTFILILMLVAGIMAYRKNYAPARYFIYANAPLVAGAIAFILREMGYLPDSWFTRYSVQVGVVIQVVMFALGLASRLNQTRNELATQRLEKERLALEAERERKALIETQKLELELRVKAQTQSLLDQNEKLTQLNAVKDKLFSVLTHDLRNPLATMQSFLKLLTEQYERLSEAEKVKLFKEAQDSLDHLNRLLFHLLQWSKSQMNLLDYAPEKVSLAEAVERNRRVLHLQARLKQITIETEIPENATVLADANMLDFILRNLVSNAIKFSHKGGLIKIYTNQKDAHWFIHITDYGVGMQPEVIQQIQTTHITTARRGTDKERGTGLGLLISREFIEKNAGSLEIQSTHGKGTTIIFSLPAT